jgi:uncharacterized protein (DUF1330 family)
MPKGYVIFTEAVHDPAGLAEYAQKAAPAMAGRDFKPLVVADDHEVLEGEWHGTRTVILEFPSVEAANDWYRSPEYQAAVPIRQAAAECNAVIVAGFDPPTPV